MYLYTVISIKENGKPKKKATKVHFKFHKYKVKTWCIPDTINYQNTQYFVLASYNNALAEWKFLPLYSME